MGAQMKPEVTIICATRNALSAVKLTLLSLKRHTSGSFKLLIADNDSDDGTLEFIKTLPFAREYSIEERIRTFSEVGENQFINIRRSEKDHGLVIKSPVRSKEDMGELEPSFVDFFMGHGQTLDWLARQVDTPFFVTLDSDVEFYASEWLSNAISIMKENNIDVMGQLHPGNGICQPRLTPDILFIRKSKFIQLSASLASFTWGGEKEKALMWAFQKHSPAFSENEVVGYTDIRIYDTAAFFFECVKKAGVRWMETPETVKKMYSHLGHMSWASNSANTSHEGESIQNNYQTTMNYLSTRLKMYE